MCGHIQLKDSKNKEKILKVSRELIQVFHKGIRIRLGIDFSAIGEEVRRKAIP